jgi:hypothetical protein
MRVLIAIAIGALVVIAVAIAGNARITGVSGVTKTCTLNPDGTCTSTATASASALAVSEQTIPPPTFDSVYVLLTFDAKGVGGQDFIFASAKFNYIWGCVNNSNGTVPASTINKKGGGGSVGGEQVPANQFDLQNGNITDGQVSTSAVNLNVDPSQKPTSLKCGKGQTPTVIGIEFTEATVNATSGKPATIFQIADNPVFLPQYQIN